MTVAITRELGKFVAGLRFEDIPADAIAAARLGFIDSIGVMLAGKDEPCVSILMDTLDPVPGDAALFWGSTKVRAPEAAWINAVATHALDFDDTSLSAHPSAALVPAIVAEAQHLGASGKDMLCAYVAGFEAWADLQRREPGQHHIKGWHPTGIFGAIAASAACASLRGLDAGKAAVALSLGASQSAGITANFGSMAKPFHAGKAAHAGVMAARLAAAGMTACIDALEHPQGFMSAVSPSAKVDGESPVEAGKTWRLVTIGLNIKQYPTCYCTHRPIDAMLDIRAAHPELRADDVEKITVSLSKRNSLVLRNARPKTGLEAKFSAEFVLACALVEGRVGLSELDSALVCRPDIQALIERVELAIDPREDPSTGYAPYDQVTVTLRNGQTLQSGPVVLARGASGLPLSEAQVRAKFMDCAVRALGEGAASALYERLAHLEDVAILTIPESGKTFQNSNW